MPRKVAFTGGHGVAVLEYQDPPLAPNEVRIQTEYASGKHGTNMALMDGLNRQGQRWDATYRLSLPSDEPDPDPLPANEVGTSGVGTIIEVGTEVSDWKVGDRVFGWMDVSETNIICVDRPEFYHWPWHGSTAPWLVWELGDLDPLLALCFEPAYVAFNCIRESNIRFGETVAIVGLGAIGLLAVRISTLSGAEQIFAVDPLPKRRQLASDFGAHHVLDPYAGDAALAIHQMSGGAGVDAGIEISGKFPALQTAIRATRAGGKVCAAGFFQGEAKGLWLGREWSSNRQTMFVPTGVGDLLMHRDHPLWDEFRAYDTVVSKMKQGQLTAPGLIDPLVSLEDVPEVFQLIEHHPEKVIKYAVRF